MKKMMAVAVLLGMSFFAVDASAGPKYAKAAKTVFDKFKRNAGTVVIGKREIDHLYREYRDNRDSKDRERLLERARRGYYDDDGYVDYSHSELYIKNRYVSQDDSTLQNESYKRSQFREIANDTLSRLQEKQFFERAKLQQGDETLLGYQYDDLGDVDARIMEYSNQIQGTPEVSNMEPVQELNCDYSVDFLPDL